VDVQGGMDVELPCPRRAAPALVATIAIVFLAGCGADDGAASDDGAPPTPASSATAPATTDRSGADPTGAWRLVGASVEGQPLVATDDELARATLIVEDGAIGGVAFCNSFGGDASFGDDGSVSIGGLAATEMACEPAGLMALEQTFLGELPTVERYEVEGDRLVLIAPGSEWRFDREPPVEPAELVGTPWVLDTLIDGDAASNVPGMDAATLRFADDGTFAGSTVCRSFTGRWVVDGASVVVTDLALEGSCADDEQALDSAIVGVLARMQVEIDGDRLTLSAPDGAGLSYAASAEAP
jgi:heat shock protein HslJ